MKQLTLEDLFQKIQTLQATIDALVAVEREELWYDSSDIKKKFKFSDRTMCRYRKDNDIPCTKIGRTYFYPATYFNKALLRKIENKGFTKD